MITDGENYLSTNHDVKHKFHLARHVSTVDTFDVSSPCILAVSSLLNSKARHELDWFDTTSLTGATQLSLLYKVMTGLYKLFTNLSEYTVILFGGTNRICVCKSIKTTKLVQASTIACLPSAMLEQHGSTCSSQVTWHVESWRDEPSGIWAQPSSTMTFINRLNSQVRQIAKVCDWKNL